MRRLLWFVIFCMTCDVAVTITDCPENLKLTYCNITVPRSSCDLKTQCNVKIADNSNLCDAIFGSSNMTTLESIAKYQNTIFYTDENGKVQTIGNKAQPNIGIVNVYPVMWGNRFLFINQTHVYELSGTIIRKEPSLKCSKDKRTGVYYFEEKELSSIPQKGLMAGGTLIAINHTYGNFNPVMEPMNKICIIISCEGKSCCISPKVNSKNANLTFISNYVKYFIPFHYLENPVITSKGQNSSYYWGVRQIEFEGKYFSHITRAVLFYENINSSTDNCSVQETTIECPSPSINVSSNSTETAQTLTLSLKMDTYVEEIHLDYYPNPEFNKRASMEDNTIVIKGKRLKEATNEAEYTIIAGKENCTIQILESNYIKCTVLDSSIEGSINVTIHSQTKTLILEKTKINKRVYYLLAVIIVCSLALLILSICLVRRRRSKKKRIQCILMDECSGQLMSLIVRQGIPFQKPSDYIKRILWTHKPPGNIRYDTQENLTRDLSNDEEVIINFWKIIQIWIYEFSLSMNMSDTLIQSLEQFGHLLKNKYFLVPALKALEKDKSLSPDHKFTYSYHLSLLFSSDLRYFLGLCEELFLYLVSQNKGDKSKKLFLSCSSITEYMILNWLGISMYSHMKESVGDMLYFFTHDLKTYLEKMPIDEVTGNAYQYFFDRYHLKMNTIYEEIQIQAEMQGVIEIVTCFTCDSIVQLKKKCLAAFYRGRPVSEIPDVDDICIESNRVRIDEFKREENVKGFTNHLTLDNWNIGEDSILKLTFAKVPQVAEANADDRYTTLGSSVARITTKSNRKFMHLQEPLDSKTEQSLTKKDVKKINLPVTLECKLKQLISKFLLSKNKFAPHCCLYNVFKKSAHKNGEEKTWLLNSYFSRFCCQFISEPNILLDINQELYMKKNLEGIKNYTVYIMKRCLRDPVNDIELYRNVTDFLSEFSDENADITGQMSTLQKISDDIKGDVSFSKENSLYYLFKMMKANYPTIHSALMKEEKACRLQLGEKFVNVIEQIEIGQTKRDDNLSPCHSDRSLKREANMKKKISK